ncbi:MFS transporter [Herbaspirillum lusitanum]|uniref:MFS transporter n=1 Tax=Herbaspirillum lusitanum TaxID=213312 RepID=A0ABW9ADC8_9BURK
MNNNTRSEPPVPDTSASSAAASASWGELFDRRNIWRALALTGGVALHAINVHIVTTILPSVVRDIGGLDYYAWNITLFVAASIVGSALTSKLLDLLGARPTYLLALLVFVAGSLICAAAPQMLWMLAGRSVQGLGGGLLAALGYALIRVVFAPRLWSRAVALVSGMWGIATLLGPAVGGIFAESGNWRLAFWALLPVALLQALIVTMQLRGRGTAPVTGGSLPAFRIALLTASVLAIALAGQVQEPLWQIGGIVIGVLLAVWMARLDSRMRRAGATTVFPKGTYQPGSVMGKLFACVALLTIATTTEIFVPYFLQVIHGQPPLLAGYMTAAMAGGWSAASLISSGRSGASADRMVRSGPLIMAMALLALGVLLPQPPDLSPLLPWLQVLALAGAGLGVGLGWPHLLTRVLQSAERGEENLASSSITTAQLYAMAVGAALAGVAANGAGLVQPGGVEGAQMAARWLFAVFAAAPLLAAWLTRGLSRQLARSSAAQRSRTVEQGR